MFNEIILSDLGKFYGDSANSEWNSGEVYIVGFEGTRLDAELRRFRRIVTRIVAYQGIDKINPNDVKFLNAQLTDLRNDLIINIGFEYLNLNEEVWDRFLEIMAKSGNKDRTPPQE